MGLLAYCHSLGYRDIKPEWVGGAARPQGCAEAVWVLACCHSLGVMHRNIKSSQRWEAGGAMQPQGDELSPKFVVFEGRNQGSPRAPPSLGYRQPLLPPGYTEPGLLPSHTTRTCAHTPQNIMFTNRSRGAAVKLTDFGLSTMFSSEPLSEVLGSAYYVAPEVLR